MRILRIMCNAKVAIVRVLLVKIDEAKSQNP